MRGTLLGTGDAGMRSLASWSSQSVGEILHIKQSHQWLADVMTTAKKQQPRVLWEAGTMPTWSVGFKEGFFERVIFHLRFKVGRVFLAEGTPHARKRERLGSFESGKAGQSGWNKVDEGRVWRNEHRKQMFGPTRFCPLREGVCILTGKQQAWII